MLGAGAIASCGETRERYLSRAEESKEDDSEEDDTTDVINWSGTHQVNVPNKNYWEPESIEEVEKIVKDCQDRGQTVRPLGSSLSPNGIALNEDGMISMANLDKVLEVDTDKKTITVQAGIPVREVRSYARVIVNAFAVRLESRWFAVRLESCWILNSSFLLFR
jgi:L-galactono-1,4-lactone dehydrogenase